MSASRQALELCDLDQLLELAYDEGCRLRLARAGCSSDGLATLERDRAKLFANLDPRWSIAYDRSLARYGRGVTLVRDRVCQGCFVTLPTSAAPPSGVGGLHLCVSCGRLLYWR